MKIIVGLGNPEEKYIRTRHNIGFMVVDELAQNFSSPHYQFSKEKKFEAEILKVHFKNEEIILVKPHTMMNASGEAVDKILRFYNIENLGDLWVIHDDLDLPLGKIKIIKGHGSAGHHGVDSIIGELKTDDFVRFRVGIGYKDHLDRHDKPRKIEEYVLQDFEGKEAVEADKVIEKTVEILEYALKTNLEKGMNRYNAK